MTANKNLKRRVRSRAAKTGESYAAALRHVRPAPQGETMPDVNLVRLATAQVVEASLRAKLLEAHEAQAAPDGELAYPGGVL